MILLALLGVKGLNSVRFQVSNTVVVYPSHTGIIDHLSPKTPHSRCDFGLSNVLGLIEQKGCRQFIRRRFNYGHLQANVNPRVWKIKRKFRKFCTSNGTEFSRQKNVADRKCAFHSHNLDTKEKDWKRGELSSSKGKFGVPFHPETEELRHH